MTNQNTPSVAIILLAVFACCTAFGQGLRLPDGRDVSIGDILFPAIYFDAAVAEADGAELEDLAFGAHDPTDSFVVQGIEPTLSLRTEHLHGFVNWNFSHGGDEWVDENEEAFLKLVDLPGDVAIRGGRMLNRFGEQNAKHLHSWTWRDAPLVSTRFLGEEGATTEGGELTVPLPLHRDLESALSISFGKARAHDHGHGHGDEHDDEDHGHEDEHGEEDHHDEDEHGEEEHHDEDEHGEEEHGHEDEHGHGEEPSFDDDLLGLRYKARYLVDDFNQFSGGASFLAGDGASGDRIQVYGLDLDYTWRENGLEPGGRQVTWQTEVMLRDREHAGEEFGFFSRALWRFADHFETGMRVGFAEGADDIDQEEVWRLSPLLAWYPTGQTHVAFRLQGNHYERDHSGDAQSVVLGFSYGFGGAEVR